MPTFADVAVDAEGVLRAWLNSLTSTLVGNTHPVDLGFSLELRRSPFRGCYGLLTRVGSDEGLGVEAASDMARISCSIFSTTKVSAAAGAVAYANTLRTLSTVKPVAAGRILTVATNITGPIWVPNLVKNHPQYLVDADIYFTQQ
jgi:hypothetical protein